jgi:hypothetical protein
MFLIRQTSGQSLFVTDSTHYIKKNSNPRYNHVHHVSEDVKSCQELTSHTGNRKLTAFTKWKQ